ncbi:uncharacterized protein LOC129786074 [Lutzomyia longipalpis]|uniref:F-box domain-containing protein n=1 Tax=Lutzomyia longipalpis TaxID=7200 RepID=A0A1B0CS54_LUTLO|nr:uncharacterized protein LOC129786074 [Lutzomyia longipalpis]
MEQQEASSSRKRRPDKDLAPYEPQAKVFQAEHIFNISHFSDEILLEILKHLDSESIYSFGCTCTRFKDLTKDKQLWQVFDFDAIPLSGIEILRRMRYINCETRVFRIRGLQGTYPASNWRNATITELMLTMLTDMCPKLEEFSLTHGFLNTSKINILKFPKTLKTVTFRSCSVSFPPRQHPFFSKIDQHLEQLQKLALEFCDWFETHDLILFSKIPNLQDLSLRGCGSLKDCVPYGSLASRFGFKKLERLDVRETPISDSDIQCFNVTTTLKELLLERPTRQSLMESTQAPPMAVAEDESLDGAGSSTSRPGMSLATDIMVPRLRRRFTNIPGGGGEIRVEALQTPGRPQPPIQNYGPIIILPGFLSDQISANVPNGGNNPILVASITDRGICGFGLSRNPVLEGVVWIRAEWRNPNTYIERLVIRFYKFVTDATLRHLATCSPRLKYLDITGTGITPQGIDEFKFLKPECTVVAEHLPASQFLK